MAPQDLKDPWLEGRERKRRWYELSSSGGQEPASVGLAGFKSSLKSHDNPLERAN